MGNRDRQPGENPDTLNQPAMVDGEADYRFLLENMSEVVWQISPYLRFTYINSANERLLGYTSKEVIGRSIFDFMTPFSADAVRKIATERQEQSRPGVRLEKLRYEIEQVCKDGRIIWVEVMSTPVYDSQGRLTAFNGITRDITERKQAEEALTKSEEKFRKAFFTSPDAVNINRLEDGMYVSINPGFTKIIGYTEEDIIGKTSIESNIWENIEDRQRLVAGLRKDGEVANLEAAFRMKGGDLRYGLMSASVIDLNGVPHILSITRDITDRKQAERRLQDTFDSLRKAVGTTIQVISSTVEARDPYTAGHQIRSADLAHAIAMEMGLPQDKIDAIRMAGSIHDIGKISIPAEILSKPTKLSDIEFALIKEHSKKGYEMLKEVESSWPLAEIVHQHHERIDGSGYPRNLKGEEICIEARILTVADVVEAMASHRPYRPGLGINAALEEIEKNRGTFYDKTIADACLTLFREKGFKLEGT